MNTAADRPPYYLGFTSLEHEVVIDALPVEGAFPPWLNGALLRTTPAKFEVGNRSYNHWFDGLAMLHKFALAQGRVSYANRFLRGGSYCDAERQGRIARGEFATDPCRTLFQRVASLFTRSTQRTQTDNANVNVAALGGEVVALGEPSLPVRFDPGTLETLGKPCQDFSCAANALVCTKPGVPVSSPCRCFWSPPSSRDPRPADAPRPPAGLSPVVRSRLRVLRGVFASYIIAKPLTP